MLPYACGSRAIADVTARLPQAFGNRGLRRRHKLRAAGIVIADAEARVIIERLDARRHRALRQTLFAQQRVDFGAECRALRQP
ncbi:MAG TPA: hypothetical protein PK808_05890, partial [Polymorphobacter sp.]|nr:hypothetical protein [Polymorphobacter sp.]